MRRDSGNTQRDSGNIPSRRGPYRQAIECACGP
jgi:hypothetical protein